MTISQETLDKIKAEGEAQDAKWGEQNGPPVEWLAIMVEEVGELAQAILADQSPNPELHQSHSEDMMTEAIQAAAVAGHFVEYLERRTEKRMMDHHYRLHGLCDHGEARGFCVSGAY